MKFADRGGETDPGAARAPKNLHDLNFTVLSPISEGMEKILLIVTVEIQLSRVVLADEDNDSDDDESDDTSDLNTGEQIQVSIEQSQAENCNVEYGMQMLKIECLNSTDISVCVWGHGQIAFVSLWNRHRPQQVTTTTSDTQVGFCVQALLSASAWPQSSPLDSWSSSCTLAGVGPASVTLPGEQRLNRLSSIYQAAQRTCFCCEMSARPRSEMSPNSLFPIVSILQ